MKGGKEQTVTQKLDPATTQMQQDVYNRARQVSNQPYTPYQGQTVAGTSSLSSDAVRQLQGVQGQLGSYANLGQHLFNQNLGFGGDLMSRLNGPDQSSLNPYRQAGATGARALGGDQGSIDTLMNPFMSGVIDQVKGQYGDLNAMAQRGINDQATKAGAFGGSRHGVASGVASGEIAKGLGQQIAGLQQQGFNDAMGRAGQAAGLGLGAGQLGLGMNQLGLGFGQLGLGAMGQAGGALGQMGGFAGMNAGLAGQQFGMGDYFRNVQQQQLDDQRGRFNEARDWDIRNFDILKSGATGMPYGSSTSQPMQRNALAGAAGGAMAGSTFGPAGAIAGGALGLFGAI